MLESLHVKNLALIRDAELELKPGLNVLSGETGAGKSLLLGSIDLALGKRADADLIRKGAEEAFVELVFSLDDEEIKERLKEAGADTSEDRIIITRRITNSRSVTRVNGETVTLAVLKKITELLIDIHGQHQHQSLLKEENHVRVLDEYGKATLTEEKAAYEASYRRYRKIREEIGRLGGDDDLRKRELDFLSFQISEIEEAHLKPGEEEKLDQLYASLAHKEQVRNALDNTLGLLREEISGKLSEALKESSQAAVYEVRAKSLESQLLDIDSLLSDAAREAETLLLDQETDEGQLKETEERLELIASLKKKYGGSVEEILSTLKRLKKEYDELYDFDVNKEKKSQELEQEKQLLIEEAKKLHDRRTEAGKRFSEAMEEALKDLNFLHVRFRTEVTETNRFTPNGADEVCFLISTNPGEEPRPLSKVASGGELSRIMLAIKTLAADSDKIPTLIFDEIDQGISGRTAAAVAKKMQDIALFHQVICISHLPQIVSSADVNFLIEKSVEDGETVTRLEALSQEDTYREIARLLGDGDITDSNLQNAREMKERMKR